MKWLKCHFLVQLFYSRRKTYLVTCISAYLCEWIEEEKTRNTFFKKFPVQHFWLDHVEILLILNSIFNPIDPDIFKDITLLTTWSIHTLLLIRPTYLNITKINFMEYIFFWQLILSLSLCLHHHFSMPILFS